jgi:deazaflavin-dependent oxidoreductase (nitroreductase family)
VKLRDRATDSLMNGMNLLHRGVLALTGGRLGWKLGPMTAIELHTVGRSSGKRRSTMLSAPIGDENRFVLVASKGGDDRHPQWYLNLVANPEVELRVRNSIFRMTARTATPAEKAELWPTITRVNPGYAGYQRKTDRDIPVVICETAD